MSTTVRRVKNNLHPHASAGRFRIDRADALLYVRGLLSNLGLGQSNVASAAIDLSCRGALMLLNNRLPAGTPVHLRIKATKYAETFDADGDVYWCIRNSASRTLYRAGIRFTNLPPGEAWKIDLIRQCFTSSPPRARTRDTNFRLLP